MVKALMYRRRAASARGLHTLMSSEKAHLKTEKRRNVLRGVGNIMHTRRDVTHDVSRKSGRPNPGDLIEVYVTYT